MLLREDIEKREYETLSPYAMKAAETMGRGAEEPKDDFRTEYQRDRDRIIHSKSFRRLMHKTQVFLAPEGDHFRTRLTHTLEVSQIARTIARALALNEDLTEAIAMGHDLGHTPFGHIGEALLSERHPGGFRHNEQSLRVVELLEHAGVTEGHGMNLTKEVRDGILNHTGPDWPLTLEGQVVRHSDRIAYINHDIDDAIRGGVIRAEDLPKHCIAVLGETHSTRISTLVRDVVANSDGKDRVMLSAEKKAAMDELRDFMFENVYHSKVVRADAGMEKVRAIIFGLYDYYHDHPEAMPKERRDMIEAYGIDTCVKDHIASMSDRYAVRAYTELFIPRNWKTDIEGM